MADEQLFKTLYNWFLEERNRLSRSIMSYKKDLDLEPDRKDLKKCIEEKENRLALITEEAIQKYQAFWNTLFPHERRPCPSCFTHGEVSDLLPMPEDNGDERVRCKTCQRSFYFPSSSTDTRQ
ncbi:hypothetical protein RP726_13450 [Candidatus Methylospira mobilis]|uniref:hypothetical protein n=1 Tax=Candidatus Methylospira mobilis TaxID=1808979 RepID=UPI0028E5CCC0|nr:hypothetical protein [Candidatus Methylospira mobilis]WNV03455.1 hypothetical protein RP726_13450 [Candidatus Methylospira mobilis]